MDRGVIATGKKGDLNIIDFDKLQGQAPKMAFDLPAGGKRLLQTRLADCVCSVGQKNDVAFLGRRALGEGCCLYEAVVKGRLAGGIELWDRANDP